MTITRHKAHAGSTVGLTLFWNGTAAVVASIAPGSLFDDNSEAALLEPGMHVNNINGIETTDEYSVAQMNTVWLKCIQGSVAIQAWWPPPAVQVTRAITSRGSNHVGIQLDAIVVTTTDDDKEFRGKITREK